MLEQGSSLVLEQQLLQQPLDGSLWNAYPRLPTVKNNCMRFLSHKKLQINKKLITIIWHHWKGKGKQCNFWNLTTVKVKKQNIWLGNLNNTGYVKTKFILTSYKWCVC
jgi:hypothetical protein